MAHFRVISPWTQVCVVAVVLIIFRDSSSLPKIHLQDFHVPYVCYVESEYDSEYSGESGEDAASASENEDKASGDELAYPEEKK